MTPEQFVYWLSGYLTESNNLSYNRDFKKDILDVMTRVRFTNNFPIVMGEL